MELQVVRFSWYSWITWYAELPLSTPPHYVHAAWLMCVLSPQHESELRRCYNSDSRSPARRVNIFLSRFRSINRKETIMWGLYERIIKRSISVPRVLIRDMLTVVLVINLHLMTGRNLANISEWQLCLLWLHSKQDKGQSWGRVKPWRPTPDKTTSPATVTAIKAQQLNLCLVSMLTRLYLLGNRLSSQLLSGCSWLMKGHRMAGTRSNPAPLSLTMEQSKLRYCEKKKWHRSRVTRKCTTPLEALVAQNCSLGCRRKPKVFHLNRVGLVLQQLLDYSYHLFIVHGCADGVVLWCLMFH